MKNEITNPFNGETVKAEIVPTNRVNKFDDMGFDVVVDLTTAQASYCSVVAETEEQKKDLYNAINNPDERLADCINMTIPCKDVYIEVVDCTNEQTGEVNACPRIVIIDDKNKSYQCVSIGVYSALKKIFQIFGTPNTWTKPIPLSVKQVTKGAKKMLTLNIAK